jgi:integrase/recombinase XerD
VEFILAREEYVRTLTATRSFSDHTIRAYTADLVAFERHIGGSLPVAVIDRERLVSFLGDQRAAGLAPSTIKRRASGVRRFCRWLLERELIAVDPWAGLTVSAGRRRKLPRNVPDAQLNALMSGLRLEAGDLPSGPRASDQRIHETTTLLAIALMIATGVRVGEVVAIRCCDIDLSRSVMRILGKGSRERQVYLTNDWIVSLTAGYLETRTTLQVKHEQLLFNRRLEPMSTPSVRARLRSAAVRVGHPSPVTPHMLRHSAATRLVDAGVDIRLIQTLLGHASLSTTEIYTHVSNAALQRVLTEVDVLGRSLRGQ